MTTEITEMNALKKPRKKGKVQQMKDALKQEFPNCFKSGNEKLPLKIGIHLQVHFHFKDDSRFDPKLIQQGLNSYFSSPKYLAKIIEGASRFDINGNPAELITAKEAAYAKNKLEILENLWQQKRESKQKKLIKTSAELLTKKPVLTLEEIRNKQTKSTTTHTPAKTKEEIKKTKQDRYAKRMARQK